MEVYVWVFLFIHGWVAKGFLSSASMTNIRVFGGSSIVFLGAKIQQRAVPARICET